MGMRSPDRYTIPMCATHHRELHEDGNEVRWLGEWGIDGMKLAAALWGAPDERQVQEELTKQWSKSYFARNR
jgi:hypothetical protein